MSQEEDLSSLVNCLTGPNSKTNNSTLISHNVMIDRRRTSVRLEKEMWMGLKEIARREDCSVHMLCTAIAQRKRPGTSLTAAIRVFTMAYYQSAATDEGHQKAGHGAGAFQAAYVLQKHTNAPYYGLRQFKNIPNPPVPETPYNQSKMSSI
ncbi:MAG TPA: ribbon-helix-helix domain-containing protein [Alphaproteobacteria bacterium]